MKAPHQQVNDADAGQAKAGGTAGQKRTLVDNRPAMVAQRKLAEMMGNSPRVLQLRALSDVINSSPRMVAQRHQMSALFGGEAKPTGDTSTLAKTSPAQRKEKANNAGLPSQLKSGIEPLSQIEPPQSLDGQLESAESVSDSPAPEQGARALYTPQPDAAMPEPARRLGAAAGAAVQLQIKKPRSQEVFGRLTTPMIQTRFSSPPSTAMVNEMKNLHAEPPPAYTWSEAVKEATRRIKNTGRKVTGRANRLNDHTDLISYAGSFGVAVPKVTTYITKHSTLFDAALTQVEFAEGDFSFGPSMTDTQMKTVVTDTMMAMPATLTRTMSAFNELADAQVLAHSVVGSAWKGNQFEQWVDSNVFPTLKFRAKFKNSALAQDRTCDGYDHATHTLWDYKHYSGQVPQDQADDYYTIVTNSIASTTGEKPTKVCYLFSDKNAAKANKWLNTGYGFDVWYVQTGMPPTPVQLY